ncbi:aminopeptidase P family N-terminal domain-containing protein [Fodinicurvata halophila]|uniref:aminopeptidase P family N-terminal domain-containing protein n=1 Tax=Fodinicurvata halophila TaxID=1419723 RepID=UPI00362D1EAB
MTGFTGSAGFAVVLAEAAAIFVDGRYTLQVRNECDGDSWTFRHVTEEPRRSWLAEHLPEGGQLGYDPWLHSQREVETLKDECARVGGDAAACPDNPLDSIWSDRPDPPASTVETHPLAFAGESSESKRQRVSQVLQDNQQDAVVLTRSDSIAWLLNIRGTDVPHCPLALSFAILHSDARVDWFINARRVPDEVAALLGKPYASTPPIASRQPWGSWGASASASSRKAPWRGSSIACAAPKRRSEQEPIPVSCPRRPRTRLRSPGHARPTCAMERRSAAFSIGWTELLPGRT